MKSSLVMGALAALAILFLRGGDVHHHFHIDGRGLTKEQVNVAIAQALRDLRKRPLAAR